MAVHPNYQRKGRGMLIMTYLEMEAAANDCYKIILDCSPKNVPFYEKNGFKLQESQMRLDLD